MILPSKHLPQERALLTVGARVLEHLRQPATVSALWHELSQQGDSRTPLGYDWFVLALDLLYALGAVDLHEGLLSRTVPAKSNGVAQ